MTMLWRKRTYYAVLVVLILAAVLTVKIKTDLSAFFIAGDNAEEILLASEMQSGSLSRRYVLSLGSTQQTIATQSVHALTQQFQAIKGVSDVWQPGDQRFKKELMKSLLKITSACMFSLNPGQDLQSLLTDSGLMERASFLKSALMSPQGGLVKEIARGDPLLLSLTSLRSFVEIMPVSNQSDNQFQNLILETAMTGFDFFSQTRIQATLHRLVKDYNQQHQTQIALQMTGVPVFAVATQRLIENDVKMITIVSSLALTLLFLVLFRSLNALLQVSLLLLTVVCSSVLLTQLIFGSVHAMTLAIGSTLIGICIDYPIHALVHANSVNVAERILIIRRIWPSMVLAGVTTLIGYFALGFSGYPGFQQITVYAGCGIPMALLITRFILPITINTQTTRQVIVPGVATWLKICNRFRVALIIVLLALSVVAVFVLQNLTWLEDMGQLTPELEQLKTNDNLIRSRMISSIEPGRFILVSANSTEAALKKLEQVYQVLDELKEQGHLKEYFGLYPWLLSQAQQRLNLTSIQQQITEPIQKSWQNALQAHGLAVEPLSLPEYSDCNILTVEALQGTAVYRLIQNQIIISPNKTLLLVWIGYHQPKQLAEAVESMQGVNYFSQKDLLNDMAANYRNQTQTMLILGLSLIVLLLLVRYKSLVSAWQTLIPALFAALFILAGWSVSGQAISFLHLVGFLLAVAICVDYGIFYKENRGDDLILTYQAMAASMLTSAIVFGCLLLAKTTSLQTLGSVVALGVLLGFAFCPIVIRHQ